MRNYLAGSCGPSRDVPILQQTMNSKTLRPPLLMNAVFSGANGLLLTLAPVLIASWLGPQTTGIYSFLGVGLLLFCLTLGFLAARPTPLAVLAVTGADLGWVISTTGAVLVWRHEFTSLGFTLVSGTNAIVLTLAWFQLRSIRDMFQARGGSPDDYQVCIAVDTPVTAEAFWRVLADLGSIHRYLPSLKSSALTTGETSGIGCERTCENTKGQVWSERCEEWEEGRSFAVTFLTDRPGFPYPFSKMRGGWRVTPNAAGCRVEVWWRVVPRQPWTAALVLPLMAANAQRTFGGVVARMAGAAGQRPTPGSGTLAAIPRLHATVC